MQPRQMARTTQAVDLGPLSGATVTRIYVDQHGAGFLLDLGPPGGIYDWRVEQCFPPRHDEQVSALDPDNPLSMVPLLSILGMAVENATADVDGTIRFKFSGSFAVECGADLKYEAWQLAGPNDFLIVCLPGGGLATWARP